MIVLCSIGAGLSSGRKFYGGIGVPLNKGRSHLRLSISNVATEINPAQEQVLNFFVRCCYVNVISIFI